MKESRANATLGAAPNVAKMFPNTMEGVLIVRDPQRLGSVVTRQEISAPRFQLGHELFRKLQFDFGIRFSEHAKEPRQTERRPVLHDFCVRRVRELFCFAEGVVKLTETVDQFV